MDTSDLIAFAIFVAVMTSTPGPGNLTFMAIGATAGFRAALPVIVASQLGSLALNLSVAFGLGTLMADGGPLVNVFKILCLGYMTYLAWRIISLNIRPLDSVRLPSFWEGLLIHPLSPKTWAMSLVAYTTFLAGSDQTQFANGLILASGFISGGSIFHSLWAMVGVSVLKLIGEGPLMRAITIVMAVGMLGATLWAMII
ncbi:MAG: LysE family translocator [Rhodobacteraceae bacterium]|nr:LysE family translocator [Paracoccaceae bacterium]